MRFPAFAVLAGTILMVPTMAKSQDARVGEVVFAACAACHDLGTAARNKIGPPLNGIFGLHAATLPGFAYSDALKRAGIVWDDKVFRQYIANPRVTVPGGKMSFAGISDESKIADLAAYLKLFAADGSMAALPAAATAADTDDPDPTTLACLTRLGSSDARDACASVGGELLQAVGAVLTGYPAHGYGTFDGERLVDRYVTSSPRHDRRLRVSPTDPCVADELEVDQQGSQRWAALNQTVYDFRKIAKVRYLVKIEDFASGATTSADNPAVNQITLEGDGWTCSRTISLDSRPADAGLRCNKGFPENAFSANGYADNKAVLVKALAVIRKVCSLPN